MNIMKKYKWSWLLIAVCLIAAGFLVANVLGLGKSKLPVVGQVADFRMENVDGSTVSRDDTAGKVRLMYFYFTSCPDVCPPTTMVLSQVQNELKKEEGVFGEEAAIVSFSFDPETDTREKIKAFGDKFFADYSGWYFLRGDQEETRQLMQGSFKIPLIGNSAENYTHGNRIALVDRENNIRKMYDASDPSNVVVADVVKDIQGLIKE
ncbi:SCO family protein [Paenibacillus lemnae]|uniref:SCO family protein n=1 Tax=Paenibacillus lemnae TaxID=1330551 RepID=A0A848M5S9_PAELE|nr:SCO family protein [Paenibacillus lemnae]NMO95609.1 SCO family protein [Paenibacillus lemnae]